MREGEARGWPRRPLLDHRRAACSGGLARVDNGEVDVGPKNLVDIIGSGVERDVLNDFDHLRAGVTRVADG